MRSFMPLVRNVTRQQSFLLCTRIGPVALQALRARALHDLVPNVFAGHEGSGRQ